MTDVEILFEVDQYATFCLRTVSGCAPTHQ